jgi:hypothetical protein
MRPPMPLPRQVEIDTIFDLLKKLGLSVIEKSETRLSALQARAAGFVQV